MSTPDWAPQNQPQTAYGKTATNIGHDQINQFYAATARQSHMGYQEFLETVDWATDKVQRTADEEKVAIELRYRHLLEKAFTDYKNLEAEYARLSQRQKDGQDELAELKDQLTRSRRPGALLMILWRQIAVTTLALLLFGTGLGFFLAWYGRTAHNTPSSPPAGATRPPAPAHHTSDPSSEAEATAREYLALGEAHDANAMLKLITPQFEKSSGGPAEFVRLWGTGFKQVDGIVSPARRPIVKRANPTVVWVQVVWRRKTADVDTIRKLKYDLDWWEFVQTPSGYKLNAADSRDRSCPANNVPACAQSDDFSR